MIALEIEWNNKAPLFDRDLENFKRLHAEGGISIGEPVAFADAWTDNFAGNKYGQATTHWDKLMHRVHRGVGNPCPLVLIGLPASMIRFDAKKIDELEDGPDITPP